MIKDYQRNTKRCKSDSTFKQEIFIEDLEGYFGGK
jgi:hypothetical protein